MEGTCLPLLLLISFAQDQAGDHHRTTSGDLKGVTGPILLLVNWTTYKRTVQNWTMYKSTVAFSWKCSRNLKRNVKDRSNYLHACPSKTQLTPNFCLPPPLPSPPSSPEINLGVSWIHLCTLPQSLYLVTDSICTLSSVRRSLVWAVCLLRIS